MGNKWANSAVRVVIVVTCPTSRRFKPFTLLYTYRGSLEREEK
jgi:hypothetical protein